MFKLVVLAAAILCQGFLLILCERRKPFTREGMMRARARIMDRQRKTRERVKEMRYELHGVG
jgi:hypothetical protein